MIDYSTQGNKLTKQEDEVIHLFSKLSDDRNIRDRKSLIDVAMNDLISASKSRGIKGDLKFVFTNDSALVYHNKPQPINTSYRNLNESSRYSSKIQDYDDMIGSSIIGAYDIQGIGSDTYLTVNPSARMGNLVFSAVIRYYFKHMDQFTNHNCNNVPDCHYEFVFTEVYLTEDNTEGFMTTFLYSITVQSGTVKWGETRKPLWFKVCYSKEKSVEETISDLLEEFDEIEDVKDFDEYDER